MKKIFLLCTLAWSIVASAQTFEFSTLESGDTYVDKYAPVFTPSAVGSDGTVYQTGLYDKMVMVDDDILENIATSAFVSALGADATPKWTVGIQGAAQVTAITTSDDAVFVTGIFADDIVLGSKDFNTKEYSGTSLSHNKVNAFIAKYDLQGNLVASEVIIPHKIPAYGDYDSDLLVYPTAVAVLGDKVYVSENFLGGYTVGSVTNEGTVKNSFGYFDSKCVSILSFLAPDLSNPTLELDMRNAEEVNTNGLCPSSICITADAQKLYACIFASGSNSLTIQGNTSAVDYQKGEDSEYGALLVTLDAAGNVGQHVFHNEVSGRYYINNAVKSMQVADGNLYLAGHVSTSLPFKSDLVPDLWTDQFATSVSLSDYSVNWASITGAKRDNMATTNEKYRESNAAALDGTYYKVIGSTNFFCNSLGQQRKFSSDTCLGIAARGGLLALTTKTSEGSKLTLTGTYSGIRSFQGTKHSNDCIFDLSGRLLPSSSKNSITIQSGKKYIRK